MVVESMDQEVVTLILNLFVTSEPANLFVESIFVSHQSH
jgi:hypothetical protein